MIELKFSGMCDGCGCADLEVDYIQPILGTKVWKVKCIHREACMSARQKLVDETEQLLQARRRTPNEEESGAQRTP